MKKLILILAVVLAQAASAQNEAAMHRVVFQMSTQNVEEQQGLIKNLNNLIAGWGNNFKAEIVAHGPGISMLRRDSAPADAIAKLQAKGIVFIACENTMHQKSIVRDDLLTGVQIVPMGLAHIIERLEQGWFYIKANF